MVHRSSSVLAASSVLVASCVLIASNGGEASILSRAKFPEGQHHYKLGLCEGDRQTGQRSQYEKQTSMLIIIV